jgi:hypothetical protein
MIALSGCRRLNIFYSFLGVGRLARHALTLVRVVSIHKLIKRAPHNAGRHGHFCQKPLMSAARRVGNNARQDEVTMRGAENVIRATRRDG